MLEVSILVCIEADVFSRSAAFSAFAESGLGEEVHHDAYHEGEHRRPVVPSLLSGYAGNQAESWNSTLSSKKTFRFQLRKHENAHQTVGRRVGGWLRYLR